MNTRAIQSHEFLANTAWSTAVRTTIAGDASNRSYDRLTLPSGETAILMDAPPQFGEDIRPFMRIATDLSQSGLSTPKMFDADETLGFLILEDFGDDLIGRLADVHPEQEVDLYGAAVDVLVHLHACPAPSHLTSFDNTMMSQMIAPAFDWYCRGADLDWEHQAAQFEPLFYALLEEHIGAPSVLMLRDYHAGNLLWLPQRHAPANVGVLDFQDAHLGHPAYDLVSLLQDARRDVPADLEQKMITRYLTATSVDPASFSAAYYVLGAQRSLRILGVFARLSMHFGKQHYVELIPRVYSLLQRDLAQPALAPIANQLLAAIPPPTQNLLQKLKDKCATIPTL